LVEIPPVTPLMVSLSNHGWARNLSLPFPTTLGKSLWRLVGWALSGVLYYPGGYLKALNRELRMSLYFLLGTLSDTGQKMLHGNPDLLVDAVRDVHIDGAEILGQYGVLGQYDFVVMAEADNNEAVARLSLELGVRVGLHIETLPAIPIVALAEGEPGNRAGEVVFAQPPPEEWRLPEQER
jgi:uncharacterized protein with GYD domain